MSNLEQQTKINSIYHLIHECKMTFRNLDEVNIVADYLANLYPEPHKVIVGIIELLLNALEHGNLGITYEQKTLLHQQNIWETEIKRLLLLPENINKNVNVHFIRESKRILLRIQDFGNGFNWKKYIDFSNDRDKDKHGRGIAIAKILAFDAIEYIEKGNEVMCVINMTG